VPQAGDDDEFITELIESYLAEGQANVDSLSAAAAQSDLAVFTRAAHTLKSTSATIGAMRLSELCRGLEEAARSGRTDGLTGEAERVQASWHRDDCRPGGRRPGRMTDGPAPVALIVDDSGVNRRVLARLLKTLVDRRSRGGERPGRARPAAKLGLGGRRRPARHRHAGDGRLRDPGRDQGRG